MASTPPPPNTGHKPSVAGQTVVEVIYSQSNNVRGIITVDSNVVYRVRTEFWDTGEWDAAGVAFWSQGHLGTFTDTFENARILCSERMAETIRS
jgi:hypothetical protein